MRYLKLSLRLLVFLLVAWIGLNCSVVLATDAIEAGQPAPYSGVILDDESVGKILLDVQTLPIVEEEKANLINQVNNLKDT